MLSNIRILDFTRVLAGPFATRIMADCGAEVIKVQSRATATGAESNDSGYFSYWNRNKKGITLNMNYPEARDIILSLVAVSDVVIENASPRVMDNWNLTYEDLKTVRSDIIMIRMSGLGQTGPWRNYVAYGYTLQSLGGLTGLTSEDKSEPVGPGHAYVDHIFGMYGALAILSALRRRERGGCGECIDVSGYEVACSLVGTALLEAAANGTDDEHKAESGADTALLQGCYRCQGDNRWCALSVENDRKWEKLCTVIGHPELAVGVRDRTNGNNTMKTTIDTCIEKWTRRLNAEDAVDTLQGIGIAASVVNNAADLADDPHLRDRGFFTEMNHPRQGRLTMDALPVRMDGRYMNAMAPSPALGEHNLYVFRDVLGMTHETIETYVRKGIIS